MLASERERVCMCYCVCEKTDREEALDERVCGGQERAHARAHTLTSSVMAHR